MNRLIETPNGGMTITESGITLTFPDTNCFRFEGSSAYRELHLVKETDIVWYDKDENVLYLIELKGWRDSSLIEDNDDQVTVERREQIREDRKKSQVKNLVGKSNGVVSMLSSVQLNKPWGNRLHREMPFTIDAQTELKLYTIANWQATDTSYLAQVGDAYQSEFKLSYAKLFEVRTYLLFSKNQAQNACAAGLIPFQVS